MIATLRRPVGKSHRAIPQVKSVVLVENQSAYSLKGLNRTKLLPQPGPNHSTSRRERPQIKECKPGEGTIRGEAHVRRLIRSLHQEQVCNLKTIATMETPPLPCIQMPTDTSSICRADGRRSEIPPKDDRLSFSFPTMTTVAKTLSSRKRCLVAGRRLSCVRTR